MKYKTKDMSYLYPPMEELKKMVKESPWKVKRFAEWAEQEHDRLYKKDYIQACDALDYSIQCRMLLEKTIRKNIEIDYRIDSRIKNTRINKSSFIQDYHSNDKTHISVKMNNKWYDYEATNQIGIKEIKTFLKLKISAGKCYNKYIKKSENIRRVINR